MIKLIALDMDGTLLNEQKELKQPQIDAIHQAIEAGVKIVLCTGRPLAGVKPFVEQLGFDTEEEFIIVNNGCSTHSTKDWSLIDWEELSISDIDYLSTFIENDDVQISLFDEEDYFVLAEKANARVNLDAGLVGMTPQPIDLKEAKSGQHRFFEAMFVGEKVHIDAFENQHNPVLSQGYSTVRSQDYLLEILPNGASKATGLKKLADRLGILPEEIMAMGDANNDLEMIEFAGLGIAMGNANEQVKAIAQDITDTNENNGVAKAIEKHILNKKGDNMKYPTLLDRFLVYVKENTRSDENSTTTPSTQNQVEFAQNILLPEMKRIGLQNVHYLPNGFAVGTLPANAPSLTRKIGFIAHMDTADFNAEGVKPQMIENYDGNPIALGTSGYELHPKDFPQLANYHGQTLITTDGTTLLGSDDKSGIAEIMTAIEFLVQNPDIKHCEIRVGFGPDEEIGVGADKFDVEDFDVDFAYTMDGGPLGELQYETFSAAGAKIDFLGRNVHPGSAKDQMINAFQMAIDFHNALPEADRPEKTEGYEGFFHLMNMEGSVDTASTTYIIRDFEEADFQARKQLMLDIAEKMNANFDTPRVIVNLHDQYYNMKKIIEKDMTPIKIAKDVMENLGIKPLIEPVRGGTDGSKISFMGIPTPNIFAGGENMHGRFEFVSLETMEKAVDVILGIVAYK